MALKKLKKSPFNRADRSRRSLSIKGKRDGGRKTREVRNEYLSDGFEAARPWPH
jgi:hypothetical protein